MQFPVWRELKPNDDLFLVKILSGQGLNAVSRLKGIETWDQRCFFILDSSSNQFECSFPFEGNWNISVPIPWLPLVTRFECSFPFEGNWNTFSMSFSPILKEFECSFPFEGNWNSWSLSVPGCYVSIVFECSFPFEGNWNSAHLIEGCA